MVDRTGLDASCSAVAPPYEREIQSLITLDPKQPQAARRAAVDVLCAALEADGALYWRTISRPDGTQLLASPLATGSAALEGFEAAEGQPCPKTPTLDLEHPRPVETRQFVALDARIRWVGEATFHASEAYQKFYGPRRIHSDMRLLVYGGGRFVGWIGAVRTAGSRRFEQKDRRRASYLVPALRSALTAAEHFEEQNLPKAPMTMIAGPDGAILHASREVEWVLGVDSIRERLAAQVRAFDRGEDASPLFHVDRLECSIVRMDATGDVGYMLTVSSAGVPRMKAAAALTATQRQIAEHAVRGATTAEIARAVGCGTETVRTHLRKIYLRLGVSSRLELANALLQAGYATSD